MKKTIIRMAKTIVVLPVFIVITATGLLAALITKVIGMMGGFVWLLLGIFAVLAIFFRQWPQLIAVGVLAAIVYFFIFTGVLVTVVLGELRKTLWQSI